MQLELLNAPFALGALAAIKDEFFGVQTHVEDQMPKEFFRIKHFSMKRKDLERHFQKMSKRYYMSGRVDDPNLKQALLSSIPESLGTETF